MYLLMKLLHIVAVIAFLGNIATGLFWHIHAARTRDSRLLAHTVDGIIKSDRLFTIPGLIFMAFVAPLQRRLLALAQAGSGPRSFDYAGYASVARRWEIWGAVALLTPAAGLVLMVLKPAL